MKPADQTSLFETAESEQLLSLDGEVRFYPQWLRADEADALLDNLITTLDWQRSNIRLYGQEVAIPRLNAWYGDPGCRYRYSGASFEPNLWTEALADIRERLSRRLGVTFNSVLANRYRDGKDSVAWHSDDEPELGRNPFIASVSFGATRRFVMKHKSRQDLQPIAVDLVHGSLLVMSGATQHHWVHQIPKTKKIVGERINLTFRYIYQ